MRNTLHEKFQQGYIQPENLVHLGEIRVLNSDCQLKIAGVWLLNKKQ